MTDDLTCCYCPCRATHQNAWRGGYEKVGWCEHHYRHGADLPCPDCAPADVAEDDADSLAHLAYLHRRRVRLANQLVVARDRLEDLERDVRRANDDFNLAQAHYQREAARPLAET